MRGEEDAAVQQRHNNSSFVSFSILAEVRDKLCSFSAQHETGNNFSEGGTIPFVREGWQLY